MGPDDLAEALSCMSAFKPKVELRSGAKTTVPEHPSRELVVLRRANDQSRRGMAVLVRRDPEA